MERFKEPAFAYVVLLTLLTFLIDIVALYYVLKTGKDLGTIVGGILAVWHAALVQGYGYQIGSSSGSKDKSDQIAVIAKNGHS